MLALACGASPITFAADNGVLGALQKKYTVTEMTPDHAQITKDGVTMEMKCPGVYSMPSSVSMMAPDNKVSDGKVQSPNMMVKYTWTKMGAHVLQAGDKVYVTKIESKSDLTGDVLKFSVLTVNDLDVSSGGQKKFDASLSFKFKKGYLEETPPEEIEQAVESVMAPDTGSDQAQNNSGGQQAQQAAAPPSRPAPPQQAAAPPPSPAPAPAGPPPTITIGESSTQVLQSMGMPQQMIDLGKKKTYVYKNMKVVFVDDKVTDVQ